MGDEILNERSMMGVTSATECIQGHLAEAGR